MRWKDAADQYCNIARTLGVIGDRWTLLIVREAFTGVRRFDDFRRHLEIARNVLTDRLQRLVDAGVLARVVYQQSPPRHEYRLTEAGRDLQPVLLAMMGWGDRWLCGPEGPPLHVLHRDCGHLVAPRMACPECNAALDTRNTQLVNGPGLPATVAAERDAEIARLREQHGKPSGAGGAASYGVRPLSARKRRTRRP